MNDLMPKIFVLRKLIAKAGAEVLVAGSAVFKQPDIGKACHNIKNAALSVVDA